MRVRRIIFISSYTLVKKEYKQLKLIKYEQQKFFGN